VVLPGARRFRLNRPKEIIFNTDKLDLTVGVSRAFPITWKQSTPLSEYLSFHLFFILDHPPALAFQPI
jgi:hypothetical protein